MASPVDPVTGVVTPIPYTKSLAHENIFPVVIGQFFSFALFGISSLQFYYCYRLLWKSSSSETKNFITLTSFAIIDLADQIAKGEFFWKNIEAAVTLGLSSAFVPSPRVSYALSVIGGAVVPRACHIYYMTRIYRISQNWKYRIIVWILLVICALVSLMAAVFALITGRIGLRKPIDFLPDVKVYPIPWLAGDAFVDLTLSFILIVYLRSQKSDFQDTNKLITRWTFMTLESGLVSAAAALTDLLLAIIYPTAPYHFAVNFILSKVYINSILILFHTITRNRVKAGGSSHYSSNPKYITKSATRSGGIAVDSQMETQTDAAAVVSLTHHSYQPQNGMDEEARYGEKRPY